MPLLQYYAKGLRLSAAGHARLIAAKEFPKEVSGRRLYDLVSARTRHLTDLEFNQLDWRTVRRILRREESCFTSTLAGLFKAYGLRISDADVELAASNTLYNLRIGTAEDHLWAAEIDASVFRQDAIPVESTLAWSKRNPHIFYVLWKNGARVGYVDAIPVDAAIFAPFRRGEITEAELPSSFVLPEEVARKEATELYIAAFVALGGIVEQGQVTVEIIKRFFNEILPEHYNEDNLTSVCAIAATHHGESLMREHLGFTLEQAADQRKDKHSFCTVSVDVLRARAKRYLV